MLKLPRRTFGRSKNFKERWQVKVIVRKLRNAPGRFLSILREVSFVAEGLVASTREALLIARRLRNTRVNCKQATGTAVINAARSWPVSDIELYLGHLLSQRGLVVYVLFDDGVLEHWDSNQVHKMKYDSPYRARWYIRFRHMIRKQLIWWAYRNPRMRLLNYSTIVRKVSPGEAVADYDSSYAMSSTKRFYETGIVDVEGEHCEYYQKSLRNCAISRSVARYVLDYLNPDLYITSHGIYSVWGPAYRQLKEAGVPIVVWQVPGTTTGHIRLIDRQDQVLASTRDWQEFDAATPLTEEILAGGEALLEARIDHQTQDTKEYFEGRVDKATLGRVTTSFTGIAFGMFPNVAWDGDTPERNLIFDNVVDWCVFTINAIRDTNHHLYIRFHPSEVTRLKGSVKLGDIIRQKIPDVDHIPNVTLIDSGEPLDTYTFARTHVDVGLIYDGTLCLELTYMGIPVIACTNGNFTPETIVFKPESREQYSHWIGEPAEIIQKFEAEHQNRMSAASKYAYWLFKESLLGFTPLVAPYPAIIDYSKIGKDQYLSPDEQQICHRLLRSVTSVQNDSDTTFHT